MTDIKDKTSLVAENKAKFELLTQMGAAEQAPSSEKQKSVKKLPIEKIIPFETGDRRNDTSGPYQNEFLISQRNSTYMEKRAEEDLKIQPLLMGKLDNTPAMEPMKILDKQQFYEKSDDLTHEIESKEFFEILPDNEFISDSQVTRNLKSEIKPIKNLSSENKATRDGENTCTYDNPGKSDEGTDTTKDAHKSTIASQPEYSKIKRRIAKQMTESFFKDTRFKRQNPFLLDQITDDDDDIKIKKSK